MLLLGHAASGVLAALALAWIAVRSRAVAAGVVVAAALLVTGAAAGRPAEVGLWLHRASLLLVAGLAWHRPEVRAAIRNWWAVAGLALAGLGWLALQAVEQPTLDAEYDRPYAAGPFAPSQLGLANAEVVARGALAVSTSCGAAGCHEQIARDWQASVHRAAGTDLFYRFAVDRMGEDYGVASTRLCVGCHEPGTLLSGSVAEGAAADPAHRQDGVGCLSCHLTTAVLDTAPHGVPANASLVLSLLDPRIALPSSPLALRRHAEAMRRPMLSQNRFCASCHQFFVPPELGGQPVGRLRLQVAEAAGTRFGDPEAEGYQSCVDCHMPMVAGDDPAAKEGRIHDHRALGANMMLPTLEGDAQHVEALRQFRTRDAGLDLKVAAPRWGEDTLIVPVVVTNSGIGHDFPTGATDVSQVWATVQVADARGRVVATSPDLDDAGFLDPRAPALSTVVLLPSGEIDFLHDLFGQVALAAHPRVAPGESRTLDVPVSLPADAQGPLTAKAILKYRRGNQRWNTWTFNWQPIVVPAFEVVTATAPLRVPARAVPPAAPAPARVPPQPGMAWIPAGEYPIGAAGSDDVAEHEEKPRHYVKTAGFYIDRVPVVNAAWQRMARSGRVPRPPEMIEPGLREVSWVDGAPPDALMDHPVVLLTAREAAGYCQALGKRLPTEAEWEMAARGATDRRWAWGDRFDPELCNTTEGGVGRTQVVGAHPENASVFGVLDMGCNVSEWVADSYRAYPSLRLGDNRDDWLNHFGDFMRSVRGASFLLSAHRARVTNRSFENEEVRKVIGFRCVKDRGP